MKVIIRSEQEYKEITVKGIDWEIIIDDKFSITSNKPGIELDRLIIEDIQEKQTNERE